MLEALADGLVRAAGFNPLASLVSAAIAAMLLSREDAPVRAAVAAAVIAVGWAVGDGAVVLAHLQAGLEHGSAASVWVTVAVWSVVGLLLGYAVPAAAGAYVGRNVTFGTGWASAAVIALTVSGMLQGLAASFA